jgi:transposase-like protein
METTNNQPEIKTLVDAVRYFSDLNVAHDFFVRMRWPNGPICPRCGSGDVAYLAKYRRFQCSSRHDARQFTVKTGTVMEDSPMGLDKWGVAIWLEINAENSISSYGLHRALGITQKSAWFMLHRIRFALHNGFDAKMTGIVEADETYIGGNARNMHKSRREPDITGTGGAGKTAVMGLLERHTKTCKKDKKCSKVRTVVLGNTKKKTIQPLVEEHVETGSHVYTDSLKSCQGLEPEFYHAFVDHAEQYVDGNVHTNGLENFWSLFKRCIKGTHVSVEPFHLFRYLDSECWRFSNRTLNDGERFLLAMRGINDKRLTYKALTGALEGAPASGSEEGSENLPN